MDDFRVETNGLCFVCLEKISTTLWGPDQKPGQVSHSVHSLQYLSRYLKVDMRKVFDEEGPVPPDLLAKVKEARLKVELCQECAVLNETFSKLYRQLEKIEMEVAANLNLVHGKMLEADKTGKLRGLTSSEKGIGHGNTGKGKLKIAKVLRNETMKKCFYKMNESTVAKPRVKILNWSRTEVNVEINKIKSRNQQHHSNVEQETIASNITSGTVPSGVKKGEYSHSDSDLSNVDDRNDDFGDYGDQSIPNLEMETSFRDNTKEPTSNPDTAHKGREAEIGKPNPIDESNCEKVEGRFKCRVCSQIFIAKQGWHRHFTNIHLKVKYKCNLCEVEFASRFTYNVHHKKVHLGVRFKCLVCSKIFTEKGNLTKHQKISSCKMRNSQIPVVLP